MIDGDTTKIPRISLSSHEDRMEVGRLMIDESDLPSCESRRHMGKAKPMATRLRGNRALCCDCFAFENLPVRP